MPFARPTRDQLVKRCAADIEAELQNGASLIRHTLERSVGVAQAGLAHSLHGHLAWVAKQAIYDTADDEILVRWANMFMGDAGQKQPRHASFTVRFTGSVASAPIAAGTRAVRADGAVFETLAADNLASTEPYQVDIVMRAIEAGEGGNTIPGSVLTLESAVDNVDASATVQGSGSLPIGGGTDLETPAALRARFLEFLQTPPRGGASGDYARWAKEVAGVTRAWEFPLQLGPSTVLVLFVRDTFDDDGFWESTGIPTSLEEEEVADYIRERCPVTIGAFNAVGESGLTVQGPTAVTFTPTIALSPNTAAVREQVNRQLQDLLLRRAEPGGTLSISQIREAISLAAGEDFHDLVSPTEDVVSATTELLVFGEPTYQDA